MPANFRIELGPCDDVGRLYVNGREIATTGLDEVRRATRVLEDGDYNVRLEVLNPGLWAWRAALRLSGDNYEILAVDEKGGSGLYGGRVFDRQWQIRCQNGRVDLI